MVARFNHPNVVSIYDLEDAPGAAFIAMEFVDGQSLDLLFWQRERLKPAQMVPLASGIAHGLAAAHSRGIVHRDIKPANVLLGRDGSVKVSDFGIADLVAASQPAGMAIFGTPGYVPPEVLQGAAFERSGDLFALGVILYYGLTGRKPFAGSGVNDIIHATLFKRPDPFGAAGEGFPPELEPLVFRLLDRDPDVRPGDALAVAAELDRLSLAGGWRWTAESLEPPRATPERRESGTRPALEAQWIPTAQLTHPNTRPAAAGSVRPPAR
jgi:serine/threonine protein kinase